MNILLRQIIEAKVMPSYPTNKGTPITSFCQADKNNTPFHYTFLSIHAILHTGSPLTTGSDLIWATKSAKSRMKTLTENMLKNAYEVEVLINGTPAKEYTHEGKTYIEGREKTTFSLRLRNNSAGRKLFVPTIDGLSVMNGEEADYHSNGYIVPAHSAITIDGWRISDKEVAAFYFSSPEESYRRRMQKGNNLGVIGVAVLDEENKWTTPQPIPWIVPTTPTYPPCPHRDPWFPPFSPWICTTTDSVSNAMCCSQHENPTPSQKLGTGWGDQKTSEVTTVEFERASTPNTTFEIYYNTRGELERAGINFRKQPLYVTPQAFPGQYCRPPKSCTCDGVHTGCNRPGCLSRA